MFYKKEFGLLKQTPKRFFKSPGPFAPSFEKNILSGKNTAMPKSSFDKEDSNMAIHC